MSGEYYETTSQRGSYLGIAVYFISRINRTSKFLEIAGETDLKSSFRFYG